MVVVVRDAEKDLGQLEGVLGHISYYDGVGENECNTIGKMTRYWIHRAQELESTLKRKEELWDAVAPNLPHETADEKSKLPCPYCGAQMVSDGSDRAVRVDTGTGSGGERG